MRNPATPDYRAEIDGLRALAVGLVLVFHFSLLPAITGGFLGVDVFFVISGFLISGILLRQLDAGRFSLATFYLNRVRRLAPPLFIVLLLTVAAGATLLFPTEFIGLIKQVFAAQFYFANIYFWRTVGYFGLSARDVILLHTWSLGVEEQYYLLYPVGLLLLHRYLPRCLWPAIALACAGSFLLNLRVVVAKPEAAFYLLPARAWQLLLGALAYGIAARFRRAATLDAVLGIGGLALIVAAATCYRADIRIPGWFAVLPALGAALLLVSGESSRAPVSRVLRSVPLVFLGRISYSLYLVHWPVDQFAARLITNYGTGWRWGMLLLSVMIASLIYFTVEQPTRARRLLTTRRSLLASYAVALLLTLSLTLLVVRSNGLPGRFPADVVRLADFSNDRPEALTECEFSPAITLQHPCRIGVADVEPEWLVYGDSHAWAAHAVFNQWLIRQHKSAYFVFLHGCPPVAVVHLVNDKDLCFDYNRSMAAFTQAHAEVRHVALVSTWRQAIEGLLSSSPSTFGSAADSVRVFTDGLHETLSALKRLGRDAYVWEPVPGAKDGVPDALARANLKHTTPDLEYSIDEYRSTYQFFFAALDRDRALIAGVFSPADALCGTGKCAVTYRGSPLYFDNGHISQSTADFWLHVLETPRKPGVTAAVSSRLADPGPAAVLPAAASR